MREYWLEEEVRKCSFCREGRDNMRHYIEECKEIGEWFRILGDNKEEIWSKVWDEELDEKKGELLLKIWKGKESKRKGECWRGRRKGETKDGEGSESEGGGK